MLHSDGLLSANLVTLSLFLLDWFGLSMKLFPEFEDDVEFAKQLIVEQGVTCLPGSVSIDHFLSL